MLPEAQIPCEICPRGSTGYARANPQRCRGKIEQGTPPATNFRSLPSTEHACFQGRKRCQGVWTPTTLRFPPKASTVSLRELSSVDSCPAVHLSLLASDTQGCLLGSVAGPRTKPTTQDNWSPVLEFRLAATSPCRRDGEHQRWAGVGGLGAGGCNSISHSKPVQMKLTYRTHDHSDYLCIRPKCVPVCQHRCDPLHRVADYAFVFLHTCARAKVYKI